jgi:hypothetical protein
MHAMLVARMVRGPDGVSGPMMPSGGMGGAPDRRMRRRTRSLGRPNDPNAVLGVTSTSERRASNKRRHRRNAAPVE